MKYALDEGSLDLAFHEGDGDLGIFQTADLQNLTADGEVFGQSGIAGTGSLDFTVAGGDYTVYFQLHDAVGSATVSEHFPKHDMS